MKFTSAIIFLSLSACISPTFGRKKKDKADEIPPPVCGSDIQCGETFAGEVELTEDLYCPDLTNGNCAITLNGKQAVLDCNKYMIHGDDSSSGKGICILNGATAINCYVQKFNNGIFVKNGGQVNDCEVMSNEGNGIRIVDEASPTSKMKISNTYIHDNGDNGINFLSNPESSETSIEVNNVKSNQNGGHGMAFDGINVKLQVQVKDSETSNNGGNGIAFSTGTGAAVDVELDGIISRYNQNSGVILILSSTAGGEVKVKGDVNLYDNGHSGFSVSSANVKVVVEKQGALNSCGNLASGSSFDADIRSDDLAIFSGNGYMCDSTFPPFTVTCDPCPCTQPQ